MKILITGASGFVGSAICEQLMVCGHDVLAVVRNMLEPSSLDFISGSAFKPKTIIQLDFTDYASVEAVMSKYKPDIVLHAGAQAIVRKSVETPKQTLDINILGTTNLLEACRVANKNLKLFYYFSTDKIYGSKNDAKEDDEYQVTCPYSASKIASEIIVKSYADTYDMPILITRSCNIYGYGDYNRRVIPNTIKEILHRNTATVFVGDENFYRQYIFIADLTRAVCFLISRFQSNGLPYDIYNIGGIGQYSTSTVVNILAKIGNCRTLLLTKENTLCEIDSQSVNINRIMEEGWAPIVSLESGLNQTFDWYAKHLEEIEAILKT
jgi:dTDP-glucose 4,6-dehydratase